MYRIQQTTDGQWTIVDERDEVALVGTLRECEDWLDFQENAERLSAGHPGWWRGIVRGMLGLVGLRHKTMAKEQSSGDAAPSEGEQA